MAVPLPVVEIDDVDCTEVKRPNPHFFKVLGGDFTQRMKIPPNFVKNLQEDMTKKTSSSSDPPTMTASLEGPTGRTWYTELEKTTTGVFFNSGWSKFARDHSLMEHELLIFRYNGCMSFTVVIFDKTACEKEDQDGGSANGGRKARLKLRNLAFGQDELGDQLKSKEMNVVETSTRKHKKASDRSKSSPVTEKEKLKAREAAHSFASENPFFVIRLKASHVYSSCRRLAKHIAKQVTALLVTPEAENMCDRSKHPIKDKGLPESSTHAVDMSRELSPFGMDSFDASAAGCSRFPMKFSRKYLPRSKTEVILRVSANSKTWSAAFLPHISERDRLSRGWSSFVCDNSLEEEDYCAFELVKSSEFLIHIFRVSKVQMRAASRARKNAKA